MSRSPLSRRDRDRLGDRRNRARRPSPRIASATFAIAPDRESTSDEDPLGVPVRIVNPLRPGEPPEATWLDVVVLAEEVLGIRSDDLDDLLFGVQDSASRSAAALARRREALEKLRREDRILRSLLSFPPSAPGGARP